MKKSSILSQQLQIQLFNDNAISASNTHNKKKITILPQNLIRVPPPTMQKKKLSGANNENVVISGSIE